jgi:hypothetical protein
MHLRRGKRRRQRWLDGDDKGALVPDDDRCWLAGRVQGQTAMGVGWMGTMYTYARQGGPADLTVAWPESKGSVLFTIIVVAEGVISLCAEARDRDTSGGLEFTASLSLRMAGEPGHQQVIGIVLFGEMGG